MNKLLIVAALTLAATSLAGTASAMPGKNGSAQTMAQQFAGFQSPQLGGLGGFKVGTGGGHTADPGDAFLPDTVAVGDPKAHCLALGGTPKSRISPEGNVVWFCL